MNSVEKNKAIEETNKKIAGERTTNRERNDKTHLKDVGEKIKEIYSKLLKIIL